MARVPSSQVLTSSTPPRPTIKACSSTHSIEEDQISKFLGSHKVKFMSLKENLPKSGKESLVLRYPFESKYSRMPQVKFVEDSL